jgi:hypothetical protein
MYEANHAQRSERRRIGAVRLHRGSGRKQANKRRAMRKASRPQKLIRHPHNTRHYGTLKVSNIPIQLEHYPQWFWDTIKASKEDRKQLFMGRRKVLDGRACRRSPSVEPKNRSELDSHADSFTNDKHENVTIGTVATYWISDDGTPYMLIIHEALYFGDKKKTTLLTPNQLRHNGLVVDDVPRQFDIHSTHSIYDPASNVRIPLSLNGVCSGFTSYKPTAKEFLTTTKIYLTSDQPWDPYSGAMERAEQEACLRLDAIQAASQSIQDNLLLLDTADNGIGSQSFFTGEDPPNLLNYSSPSLF